MKIVVTTFVDAVLTNIAPLHADEQADISALRKLIAVPREDGWRIRMLTWNDDPRKWEQEPVE